MNVTDLNGQLGKIFESATVFLFFYIEEFDNRGKSSNHVENQNIVRQI